jgi:predicted enzyme related to lactoylglutathione lyase
MANEKPGAICHVELTSSDPAATKKFLEGVFGWKFKDTGMPMPDGSTYWTFEASNGPGGGLTKPMSGMPPDTLNYVLVDSVEASLKKIKSHGGKVMMERTEIPTIGWFAIYEVPGGIGQAIYEPLKKA